MSKQRKYNWQTLFEEQEINGLTVVAFCKERNIHPQTFYSRRYKLRKRNQPDDVAKEGDFMTVKRVAASSDIQGAITVRCGEVSIHIPANFDIDQLTALIKELR